MPPPLTLWQCTQDPAGVLGGELSHLALRRAGCHTPVEAKRFDAFIRGAAFFEQFGQWHRDGRCGLMGRGLFDQGAQPRHRLGAAVGARQRDRVQLLGPVRFREILQQRRQSSNRSLRNTLELQGAQAQAGKWRQWMLGGDESF